MPVRKQLKRKWNFTSKLLMHFWAAHFALRAQTGEEVMSEKMEINGENGKMVENTFGKLLEVM